MKSKSYTAFFLAALLLSTGISYVGYRYLGLANAYREANFLHLNAVDLAIDLLNQDHAPDTSAAARLTGYVDTAEAQARWCIETLGPIDRMIFSYVVGGAALGLCLEELDTIVVARDHLATLSDGSITLTERLVEARRVHTVLDEMREHSLAFQPLVTEIQWLLETLVRFGTGAVSLLLMLISLLVGRQLSRAQGRIATQLVTDPLTGLLNRRGLDKAMKAKREGEVVLIRIDLDRFKQVNDVLGHNAGDVVLCHIAEIMRRNSSARDALARVGGDEFVILCAPDSDLDQAYELAGDILEEVLQPLDIEGKSCVLGASFGIASSAMEGLETAGLLNAADKALYAVKRTGRGAVAVYSQEMHAAAERDRMLADGLRNALEQGEIVPYFQTQHFAGDRKLFGLEVLCRWEHPTEGLLLPDQFLGIARQMGLEAELDRMIFRRTVEMVTRFKEEGYDIPRVAFNVGAARITDKTFLEDIQTIIPGNRERFAFEILESVSYEEASDVLTMTIDAIKDLGFLVDVDDFGSGHASINSLLAVGPDALKIDRNIINSMVQSPEALRMVVSIADLAHALGLHLIAEGVDTEEKAELLDQMGCHVLQGYLFSRPMPGTGLAGFLGERAETPGRAVAS